MNNSITHYLFFSEKYNWGQKIMWWAWGLKNLQFIKRKEQRIQHKQLPLSEWCTCLLGKKGWQKFPILRGKKKKKAKFIEVISLIFMPQFFNFLNKMKCVCGVKEIIPITALERKNDYLTDVFTFETIV